MDLMVTVLGMDQKAVEMDQETEMVEGQEKEDGARVDLVDQEALEVPQEELEELEVWEVVDLTVIVLGMVLAAAMVTPTERERNLEEAEKENH